MKQKAGKQINKKSGTVAVFWGDSVKDIQKNKFKYIIILPILIYLIVFSYKPMYGIIIAFMDYNPIKGMANSKFVGLRHFISFFKDIFFVRVLRNTLSISFLSLLIGFPLPIFFALLLNEIRIPWFKKTVQTITYMPHFISTVVICGMITMFSQTQGVFNDVIVFFGGERSNLLSRPELFYPIHIFSGIWQSLGWSSIIYLAALSGIDTEQYEAAKIDGASRIQQMLYITLPGLAPTISTMLILRMGDLLRVGHEKILLLYQPTTYEVADVISTYVYRRGLEDASYSYSTAVGLFESVVNIIMLLTANKICKKLGQSGLF